MGADAGEAVMTRVVGATTPVAEKPAERAGAYAWYVVGFLTLAGSLSSVDRQVLALMIGPIKRDFHITDSQMGLLGGLAFTLLYTFCTVPAAWIADRGSRRAVVTGGVLFWSLMTSACGLTHRFTTLFLTRMGVGVGEATLGPAAYSMMSDLFTKRTLPVAVGLFTAAPFIGVGVANVLGGPLVQLFESITLPPLPVIGAVKSWQLMFLILGAPGILVAIIGRFTLKEPQRKGLATGDAHKPLSLRQVGTFFSGRARFLSLMFIAYICLSIQGWALFFWVVEFLVREHHVARGQAGLIYGLMAFVLGLAGSVLSGRLASQLLAKGAMDMIMRLVLAAVLVLGPLAILMPLAPQPWQIFALLVPITFLMGWPGGLGTSALQFIAPNELKGRIVALYYLVVNFISLTLGPWLGGVISDKVFAGHSLGGSLCLMAAVDYPVAALCLFLCLRPFRAAVAEAVVWEAA